MNWLTIVILVVLAFLTFRAYQNGFIREIVSLSAVILAIPIAGLFYERMATKVHPIVDSVPLANLISFLAIMGGVIIGGQVASYLLKGTVQALNLGAIDHSAGAIFGFIKGVVACQTILIALVVFPKPDLQDEIDDSPLARGLVDTAPLVLAILPSGFDHAVHLFLTTARNVDSQLGGTPTPSR
jgi:uncharacterized membrane protein required for colicin V production